MKGSDPQKADPARPGPHTEPDLDLAQRLTNLVGETDLVELVWERNGRKVTLKRLEEAVGMARPPAALTEGAGAASPVEGAPAEGAPQEPRPLEPITIRSTMVGTFYRAPAPDKPNFVEVDDRVDVGQKIFLIEAMKVMKVIPSEVKGRLVKVLVENGHAVEYGQGLFLVQPDE